MYANEYHLRHVYSIRLNARSCFALGDCVCVASGERERIVSSFDRFCAAASPLPMIKLAVAESDKRDPYTFECHKCGALELRGVLIAAPYSQ